VTSKVAPLVATWVDVVMATTSQETEKTPTRRALVIFLKKNHQVVRALL
jgi:hypothetical protein